MGQCQRPEVCAASHRALLDPLALARNYISSTLAMRKPGGMVHINRAIEAFSKKHKEHIMAYDPNSGEDNKRRLTGAHETAR